MTDFFENKNRPKRDIKDNKITLKDGANDKLTLKLLTINNNESLITKDKTIIGAINEINNKTNASWIPGEYKWMSPLVTTMPEGWKKVLVKDGYTLIQSYDVPYSAISLGEVGEHKHGIGRNRDVNLGGIVAETSDNKVNTQIGIARGSLPTTGEYIYSFPVLKSDHESNEFYCYDETRLSSGNENLAAGMYATLWVYDPENIYP